MRLSRRYPSQATEPLRHDHGHPRWQGLRPGSMHPAFNDLPVRKTQPRDTPKIEGLAGDRHAKFLTSVHPMRSPAHYNVVCLRHRVLDLHPQLRNRLHEGVAELPERLPACISKPVWAQRLESQRGGVHVAKSRWCSALPPAPWGNSCRCPIRCVHYRSSHCHAVSSQRK
jgi:hypothetical protein